MPALSVFIDGDLRVRVSTEGLHVLAINIGGTKTEEPIATVHVSGGAYPETGESTHLIWLSDLELDSGQCVRVELDATGRTSHKGKTIKELFPDDLDEMHGAMPSRHQVLEDVRSRQQYRDQLCMSVRCSSGAHVTAATGPGDHGLGASFLWNWLNPERVSASLHSYSLSHLESGEAGDYYFREHLHPGSWVELHIEPIQPLD
jgi:hypothetical protein